VKSCKELNWAILDYAALVCKKSNPNCIDCKLSSKCKFFAMSNIPSVDNCIDEPQLNISYDSEIPMNPQKPLKVVSLFSGCGGMDLGFEGDFIVHKDSINEIMNPDFIEKSIDNKLVKLRSTKFQTVFANDILPEARNAWVRF
jgi:hypothetical protein